MNRLTVAAAAIVLLISTEAAAQFGGLLAYNSRLEARPADPNWCGPVARVAVLSESTGALDREDEHLQSFVVKLGEALQEECPQATALALTARAGGSAIWTETITANKGWRLAATAETERRRAVAEAERRKAAALAAAAPRIPAPVPTTAGIKPSPPAKGGGTRKYYEQSIAAITEDSGSWAFDSLVPGSIQPSETSQEGSATVVRGTYDVRNALMGNAMKTFAVRFVGGRVSCVEYSTYAGVCAPVRTAADRAAASRPAQSPSGSNPYLPERNVYRCRAGESSYC